MGIQIWFSGKFKEGAISSINRKQLLILTMNKSVLDKVLNTQRRCPVLLLMRFQRDGQIDTSFIARFASLALA